MTQEKAFDILKSGKNVFLTGSAGTGKTYLLNKFIKYLRDKNKRIAITASTGIAATHIDGVTIHSWCGLGISDEVNFNKLRKIERQVFVPKLNEFKRKIKRSEVLIIDEISMLHKNQLNMVNETLKFFRKSKQPFGGIQIVFCGDFFQLPPVGKKGELPKDKYCFMSKAWVEAKVNVCYLTEQHRQKKDSLLNILNNIRDSNVSISDESILKSKINNYLNNNYVRLYTKNIDVDRINEDELSNLKGDFFEFDCIKEGNDYFTNILLKQMLVGEKVKLKIGAKVMFVKNDSDGLYVNGTQAVVNDLGKHYVSVLTNDGRDIIVRYKKWSIKNNYGDTIASVSQLPLKLAWAITIHKSQGMTIDNAEIDLSDCFENGQGYVALSRLKSLSGLNLKGVNKKAYAIEPLVMKADERFRELSEQL